MGYQETASEKAKRQAKEAKWKADAEKKSEKVDYEVFGSRGDAARKGMEEGKTNPMGDTYKKGGKIMSKKTKRYDEGGFATEEGENKMIDDDVRARAMAALEKGISDEAPAKAAPKAKSFASKAKDAGFTSAETKGGAALMTRKDRSTSTAATPKRAVRKSSSSDVDYSVGNAMKKGGSVGSASRRADGCAVRGKTKGRMV